MRHDSKGRADKEVTVGFLHFLSSFPQPWRRQRLLFDLRTTSPVSLHFDSRAGYKRFSSRLYCGVVGVEERVLPHTGVADGPASWPGQLHVARPISGMFSADHTSMPCPAPAISPPLSPSPSLPRRKCWPGWLAFLWYLFHGMVSAPPLLTSLSLPAWLRLAALTRETAKTMGKLKKIRIIHCTAR